MSLGKLTWLGHSTFVLETPGGKRVMFDPWVTGNPAVPEGKADPGPIDVMLVSHGHGDHTGDLARLAGEKQPKAVVGKVELMGWFESQGVANTVGINTGGSTEVEGLRVTMTHAQHSSSVNAPDGSIVYTGEPAGFVLQLENGYKVYFAGDTSVFSDMALIRELDEPDMAILPIGDFYTMGPAAAAKAVELLGVRRVLGMHYGTFPVLVGTPGQLRDACAARGLDVTVEELSPGETLE
jgi:L-ascorbate metabolism protein UlaG (beta-lactamase superfamily)